MFLSNANLYYICWLPNRFSIILLFTKELDHNPNNFNSLSVHSPNLIITMEKISTKILSIVTEHVNRTNI